MGKRVNNIVLNKKILVVEDELVVAKNIESRLTSLGYSVPAVVSNGEEAIQKAAEIQPDLVLMDIKLEGEMDGVEAANQIWQRFNIPVIYLTAYGDEQTLQRAKITEPYGYILKPFEIREIHSNIEMALHKHNIETKLRDNEEWLSTVLESIGDAVIATDNEECITFMNPTAVSLTGWKYNDAKGKSLKTVFNIINEKTRDVEDSLAKEAIEKDAIVNLEDRNVLLITKDGEEKPIDDSAAPIKDNEGNITGSIIVFHDITNRRQTELELDKHRHQLEDLVEKRTEELTKTNEQLQQEVTNRRKAEEKSNEVKDNLENIIDSASEVIVSIDKNNRVSLWNRTAEIVTGFNRREITEKHISKLPVFNWSDELFNNFKNITNSKISGINELILKTKNGEKRIIKVSCSPVKTEGKKNEGILFVGTDITRDLESHGRLLRGNSYLIPEKDNKTALNLYITLSKSDHQGLYITRDTPEMVKSMDLVRDSEVALLSQEKLAGFENISDQKELITKIKKFSKENKDPIILFDGIHYLLTRFSFEKFTDALYQIREIVSSTNSILLMHLDPSLLDKRQMAVVENELMLLPSHKIDDIIIGDELHNILVFVYEQNKNNTEVPFKKISKQFDIVSKTATKKIRLLEDKGLIFIKKQGRLKTLHVSQKGKTLLQKRQVF